MKGCFSLLLALIVLAVLLAGGYWLYTKAQEGEGRLAVIGSSGPTLTLKNQTSFALTVELTKPGRIERFMLSPGESEKRSIQEGTYAVEGRVSDPDTSSFAAEWTFDRAMNYDAAFTRDGEGGGLVAIRPTP